jgi:hypothetical protein
MLTLRKQLALATIAAILTGLLLLGISYILTPYTLSGQMPLPVPSTTYQIFIAFLWLGLAALIAVSIVGLGIVISRMKQKRTPGDYEAQAEVN